VDIVCFGLLGLGFGYLAARKPAKHRTRLLVAADAAAIGAFVVLRVRWRPPIFVQQVSVKDFLIPLVAFAAAFAVVVAAVYLLWKPVSHLAGRIHFSVVRILAWGLALAGVISVCGIGYFLWSPFPRPAKNSAGATALPQRPNIVFIVLDTVRADHLSSYGYSRPTTPNIDRLARHGVLFENAIAPSSWTLASHASMFTGLLPQQDGVDWWIPLPRGPRTLAEALGSSGYETAGFVANFDYLQKGWGIGRGFQIYRDDSESFRRGLARTLLGTALIQPAYQTFWRFDYLERQNARDINQEVFRWFHSPPSNPFFLFINYFDTHVSYLTQPPYDHRFGKISNRVIRKLFDDLQSGDPPQDITPADRAMLINAYDNCLAFLDAQVGRLLDFLHKSPEGRNTIIIVTSDHGEAFGEQGYYSHGYNLYRELLHVPLIIAGPGIPKDVRISHLVRTRELFSTVLDLAAGGKKNPFSRNSLARFWNPQFRPQPYDNFVVSELAPIFNEDGTKAMISLTTPEWQYIYNSTGRKELYHWPDDPLDQKNLAGTADAQATMEKLHNRLVTLVANSSQPWRNTEYLFSRCKIGRQFMRELLAARKPVQAQLSHPSLYIGASQAFFTSNETSHWSMPARPDQESLKSLPYH